MRKRNDVKFVTVNTMNNFIVNNALRGSISFQKFIRGYASKKKKTTLAIGELPAVFWNDVFLLAWGSGREVGEVECRVRPGDTV